MIRTRTRNWLGLAAALFCFAACGKMEDGISPQLSMPAPGAAEKVAAQAEVKGSSGPVELAFRLHKTQIKAGDYLWQQILIRNIGEKMFVVADQVFHDPRSLRKHSDSGYGIYVEAIGPDGRRMKVEYSMNRPAPPMDEEVSGLQEVDGPKEQAMLDGWKKQGLGPEEVNRKLLDYNMNKRSSAAIRRRWPVIKLLPGQSAETKSAFFYSIRDEINEKPVPQPIGDFAQIDFFYFDKPGNYRIRAVYDHLPRKLTRKYGSLESPSDVLVRTPWVPVTVLP